MKNINTTIFVFTALIIWAGFLYFKDKNEELATDNSSEIENETVDQRCFIWNTEAGDSANIIMNINGDKVDGEFNWIPAEKDKKVGKFTGDISKIDSNQTTRTLDVFWDSYGEGMRVKEELKIIMDETIASPGFGEMKDRGDGVYVYSNPENINYDLNLSLTSCNDEFLK